MFKPRIALLLAAALLLPVLAAAGRNRRRAAQHKAGKDGQQANKEKRQQPSPLSGAFKQEAARAATRRLGKAFWTALDRYYKALAFAKSAAARKTDVEEAARIEDALGGMSVDDFTSGSAKSARRTFLTSLETACRSYGYQLQSVMRAALKAGDMEEAQHIKQVLDAIEQARAVNLHQRHSVSVYANKDWQKSGILVKKGAAVIIEAAGKWSPGTRKRTGRGKWELIYGDADTYNLQARVGDQAGRRGGKSWRFTARRDGELSFRMAPYKWRGRLGEARGTLRVKVTVDLLHSREVRSLEDVVRALVPAREGSQAAAAKSGGDPAAKPGSQPTPATHAAPRPSHHTLTIKATRTWQDTVIDVPAGATVSVLAEGIWSPGLRKVKGGGKRRWRRVRGDADRFNIEAMVAGVQAGHGGKSWTFKAPAAGAVCLRMWRRPLRNVRGDPEGSLMIKLSITPPATLAP